MSSKNYGDGVSKPQDKGKEIFPSNTEMFKEVNKPQLITSINVLLGLIYILLHNVCDQGIRCKSI